MENKEELKKKRTLFYKEEYIKNAQPRCGKCGDIAKVTYFDQEWKPIDLCNNCYQQV
jgi:hypothetical protein